MSDQSSKKSWRGYIYVAFGLAFGIYSGVKVEVWGAWEYVDQLLALAMIVTGVISILKK